MNRILSWAMMAAALALMVAWEATPLTAVAPDPVPARQAPADALQGTPRSLPETSDAPLVATALERPLFQENRRPVKVAGSAGEMERTARLTGVMTGPFGSRAIFASPGARQAIVVSEGGRVSDFIVRSISPGLAIVERETGTSTLRLSFATATTAASPHK